MYNETIKVQFIREYTDSIVSAKMIRDVFNFFEEYERDVWQADLCTVRADKIQPVADKIFGVKERSGLRILTILRAYAKWCMNNRVVPGACAEIYKVRADGLDNVKSRMLANPLHMQSYLDSIFEPEYEETMDNVYRCFYWLAFGGVDDSEITDISIYDVDFENMAIYVKGRYVPLYAEALPAFRNCVKLQAFRYKHPLYNEDIYRERVYGDMLVRGFSADRSVKAIRVEISRKTAKARKDGEKTISYSNAFRSGHYYRLREMERAGMPITFDSLVTEHLRITDYTTDDCQKFEAKKRSLEREYKKDYERWNIAFGL